jgi:hypothetical protein
MSNSLAISAVSAVLQDMLQSRLAGDPVASVMGSVTVSVLPPDRVALTGATDPNQVNLFLHQVSRNSGWANVDLPSRGADGRPSAAPPLVLDLHYLLTVFGATPLYSEILLGECMLALHEQPVPSRAVIERALAPAAPPTGFPTALALSGLADQMERIRIAPSTISAEDVSRLWSAMQARYRSTVAYQVTTVIIESTLAARRALPVGRRVGSVDAVGAPQLHAVEAALGPLEPVLAGTPLRLRGRHLRADDMRVEIGGIDLSGHIGASSADEVQLSLPAVLPAGLRPGVLGVRVLHRRPMGSPAVPHVTAESNVVALLLRPAVTASFVQSASEVVGGVTLRSGTLTLSFTTPVARHQRVRLLLNRRDAPAGADLALILPAPDGLGLPPATAETSSVAITLRRVPQGSYLVRASVDGADSLLAVDAGTGRYATPEVSL